MGPRRVLILYYSLTGQTAAVLDRIAAALRAGGHAVDVVALRTVGGAYRVPYGKARFFWEWLLAWLGVRLRVEMERAPIPGPMDAYSVVILGHQPWYLDTSIPMASWLESEQARILAGRKVISVITARTLWERAFRRLAARVEALGGEIVDSFVLRNLTPMPQNMPLTLHYLFEGHDPPGGPLARLGRFGVGEAGLDAASAWGRILALRLSHDLLEDGGTHTEGNRQGLLRGRARDELARWRRGPDP